MIIRVLSYEYIVNEFLDNKHKIKFLHTKLGSHFE